ncbi:hypothetical protein PENTCL1PPCAC_18167, partial [Pristionchus entomophagus]
LPLLFLLHFTLQSDEICYPSVFLHSTNSLPSTAPLCLVVKNDRSFTKYSPPVPIQNEDQWADFVRENNLQIDKNNEVKPLSPNLIYRVSSSGQIYPWQLPYSFQSEKCHGVTGVEFKVPLIVDCQSLTEFTQESCERNPLSATALVADEIILEGMNGSITINSTNFDLLPPVWRDGICLNFMLKARLTIFLTKKENEMESSRVDRLIYGVISSSNFSSTIPEIEIRYDRSIRRKGETVETGFEEGDFVLMGDGHSVWRLPSGLDCLERSTVRFKKDFVSTCLIGFSSCPEAQNGVNSLLSVLPSSLLDSPFIDNTTNSITFVSPKEQSIVSVIKNEIFNISFRILLIPAVFSLRESLSSSLILYRVPSILRND